jgi:hypothetical protein
MGVSPVFHTLDIRWAGKVILIFWLAQPLRLARFFTGFSTLRLGTVLLVIGVARIRGEKIHTVLALTFLNRLYHRPLPPGRIMTAKKTC